MTKHGGHKRAHFRSPKGKNITRGDTAAKQKVGRRKMRKQDKRQQEAKIHRIGKTPSTEKQELPHDEFMILNILHMRKLYYYPGCTIQDLSDEYLPSRKDLNIQFLVHQIILKKGWIKQNKGVIHLDPTCRLEISEFIKKYKYEYMA